MAKNDQKEKLRETIKSNAPLNVKVQAIHELIRIDYKEARHFLLHLLETQDNLKDVFELSFTVLPIPALDLVRALLKNPHLYSWNIIKNLSYNFRRTEILRTYYWLLPSSLRLKLLEEATENTFYSQLRSIFEKRHKLLDRQDVRTFFKETQNALPFLSIFRLLPIPSQITPWNYYALSSIEELCGLKVKEVVDVQESDELRFHYLFSECCPHGVDGKSTTMANEYRSIWDDFLNQSLQPRNIPFSCNELEQLEREIDEMRDHFHLKIKEFEDEIEKIKHQQKDIADELKERLKEWLNSLSKHSTDDLSTSYPAIPLPIPDSLWKKMDEIKSLFHGQNNEAGLFQKEEEKRKISDHLYQALKEKGVKCRRIVIEGVLGCYSFNARLITLYPIMMKLVFPNLIPDFTSHIRKDLNEMFRQGLSALQTIVEIHESVHAIWHLGEDMNGDKWKCPEDFSSEFHETIAQYYTLQMIKQLPSPEIERIKYMFEELNKKQTFPYQLFRVFDDIPPEEVRAFLLRLRQGRYSNFTYGDLWGHVLKTLASLYGFYLENLPEASIAIIRNQAASLMEGIVSLDKAFQFIQQIHSIPPLKEMIQISLGRPLPDREELIQSYLEQIYRNGQKNGDTSRFTLEAAQKADKLAKPKIDPEVLNYPVICNLREMLSEEKEISSVAEGPEHTLEMD